MRRFTLVFLMVCLAALAFTTAAYATPAKVRPGDPIPGKCLDCHAKKDGAEVSNSYHAMMGKGLTNEYGHNIGMYAGWCAMPNFQLDEQGHAAWVTNCTGCHVGGGVDPNKEVQCQLCHDCNDPSGAVTVASCTAACHQAKDLEKRGDVFDAATDWHISRGMTCQGACHLTSNHAIAKGNAIDTEEPSNETLQGCTHTGCHSLTPHTTDPKYNDHTDKVYCTVCHTGTRAAGAISSRDWTKFNDLGKPVTTSRAAGWLPVKKWWDGQHTDANGLPVLDYASQKDAVGAKIYAFNEAPISYFIKSSADKYEAIITPHVKAADANGDKTTTVTEMQSWVNPATGLVAYPNAATNTDKFNWAITHGTKADSQAFHCTDCHSSTGWVMNWTQLGYPSDPGSGGGSTVTIRVSSITMGKGVSRNKNYATATVKITDTSNNVISGASVAGSWSGLVSGTPSGATDANGNVTFTSPLTKSAGTITFTVTNVAKDGCTYDSAQNTVTSASIAVP